ncbi:MAG: hypothetical protein GTN49_08315 [candidate division Zixibacteria bacterium]|nr:hypothetical protein [candidate division Zixibacteria bacterium]
MRRLVMSLPAAALPFVAASCLSVIDVVQPLEVRPGSEFEVVLVVRADADSSGQAKGPAFGILAVSLPEGAGAKKANFDGAAKGKLKRLDDVDAGPLGHRAGYKWAFFRTRESYEMSAFVARTFDVKLKVKAPKAPGDYRLAFAAGVAPATAGAPDLARLEWEGQGAETVVTRWVTVK